MAKMGYVNGDVHIHTPYSEIAYFQMVAEDLNVLCILEK